MIQVRLGFLSFKGLGTKIQGHIKISMSDSQWYLLSRNEAYITKLRISIIAFSIKRFMEQSQSRKLLELNSFPECKGF